MRRENGTGLITDEIEVRENGTGLIIASGPPVRENGTVRENGSGKTGVRENGTGLIIASGRIKRDRSNY